MAISPALIEDCKNGLRKAQRRFYDAYSAYVLTVCLRYFASRDEAEDAMIQAMYKALTSLDKLRDPGSFNAWIRRVAVNECLMILRARKMQPVPEDALMSYPIPENITDHLESKSLLSLLSTLPLGSRTVFNLYVIEGYSHKEIADLMGISINTSKSQFIYARKKMAALLGRTEQLPTDE